jgi:hypothetical protein
MTSKIKLLSDYKTKIVDANIPYAETSANLHVPDCNSKSEVYVKDKWNKVYHTEMDKLCKTDGVRV